MDSACQILLTTLNARYIHASLGLRYLRANLGSARTCCAIAEFTIKRPPAEIVAEILARKPRLVGFGVYIWNTRQTAQVIRELKRQSPNLLVVGGGPEISFETEEQELHGLFDFIFQGEADFTFRDFILAWMERGELPAQKIIAARLPEILQLQLPYDEYTDHDLECRTLYVEASRGCPYKCEYCLSSLDRSVRTFELRGFLAQMEKLIVRGARQFKFVDRTFNLAPSTSQAILEFFLRHIDRGLFLHFELVPDRLPEGLKQLIRCFPEGALQFEIGIQTWNPIVARNVSRRQDYTKICDNLRFLREQTKVHTHCDLIVGLPGEGLASFAEGFNALYELEPDEIQVGVLKRLKGTPIVRHDMTFNMRYSAEPPFAIQSTSCLTEQEISTLKVFADFWDLLINSGRFLFLKVRVEELEAEPFRFFYEFAQWLFKYFAGRTHSIHLRQLEEAVAIYLRQQGWGERPASDEIPKHLNALTPQRQAQHQRARQTSNSTK